MTHISVNNVTSLQNNSPVIFAQGLNVTGSGTSVGSINVTGVVTATTFSGDGSSLTGLSVASISLTTAYKFMFGNDEFLSPRS
jgi:hypothetical protein